jgi:hypothetical protein
MSGQTQQPCPLTCQIHTARCRQLDSSTEYTQLKYRAPVSIFWLPTLLIASLGSPWMEHFPTGSQHVEAQPISRLETNTCNRAVVRVRAEHVGFVMDKAAPGQVFSSTSVSPNNYHSTNFSIITITRGWQSRRIGGRSVEWTQLNATPSTISI